MNKEKICINKEGPIHSITGFIFLLGAIASLSVAFFNKEFVTVAGIIAEVICVLIYLGSSEIEVP